MPCVFNLAASPYRNILSVLFSLVIFVAQNKKNVVKEKWKKCYLCNILHTSWRFCPFLFVKCCYKFACWSKWSTHIYIFFHKFNHIFYPKLLIKWRKKNWVKNNWGHEPSDQSNSLPNIDSQGGLLVSNTVHLNTSLIFKVFVSFQFRWSKFFSLVFI